MLVFTGTQLRYYEKPRRSRVHIISKDRLLSFLDQVKNVNYDQARVESAMRDMYN